MSRAGKRYAGRGGPRGNPLRHLEQQEAIRDTYGARIRKAKARHDALMRVIPKTQWQIRAGLSKYLQNISNARTHNNAVGVSDNLGFLEAALDKYEARFKS